MSGEKKDGGPAFPSESPDPEFRRAIQERRSDLGLGVNDVSRLTAKHAGMTLRDYFAGQALAGMLARDACADGSGNDRHPVYNTRWQSAFSGALASNAYDIADAMLAERAKR